MKFRIKQSFACRSIDQYFLNQEKVAAYTPKAGDVGIFRIKEANCKTIIDKNGIPCYIFDDDLFMCAFGNRYATNQVEGYVPNTPVTDCQLMGRGGVVGMIKSINTRMKTEPTELELIAYAVDDQDQVLNTIDTGSVLSFNPNQIKSKIILSIGSTMDSGKTTTAAYLSAGLSREGHTTAYIKLTGTAYPKDVRRVYDRGADYAIDFTLLGYPSTFNCELEQLLDIYQTLVEHVQEAVEPDYIVIEIADGILQRETAMLLGEDRFMQTVQDVVLSCGDSLSVFSALRLMERYGIKPFAVSGLFTASELLISEVADLIPIPIMRLDDLLYSAVEYLEGGKPKSSPNPKPVGVLAQF